MNPDLGTAIKVLAITLAVVMVITAGITGGATMAIVMLLLVVATQIPIKGKTGIQWVATGIANQLIKDGVPADKARIIGDSIALAIGNYCCPTYWRSWREC